MRRENALLKRSLKKAYTANGYSGIRGHQAVLALISKVAGSDATS